LSPLKTGRQGEVTVRSHSTRQACAPLPWGRAEPCTARRLREGGSSMNAESCDRWRTVEAVGDAARWSDEPRKRYLRAGDVRTTKEAGSAGS